MIQQKKNERAMSITFHFLRGLKKVLLHTYVVADRRLLKNTVHLTDIEKRMIFLPYGEYTFDLYSWSLRKVRFLMIWIVLQDNISVEIIDFSESIF